MLLPPPCLKAFLFPFVCPPLPWGAAEANKLDAGSTDQTIYRCRRDIQGETETGVWGEKVG